MGFFAAIFKSFLVLAIAIAAVLALGYFLIAKPLLDEADESTGGVQQAIESVGDTFEGAEPEAWVDEIRGRISGSELSEENARRLGACIRRAGEDPRQVRRCVLRFTR